MIVAIELHWRIKDSEQPWTVARYAPDLTTITLTGLIRGETYEAEARYVQDFGPPSSWATADIIVSDTDRIGTTALPPVVSGNVSSRWVSGTEITWSATETACTINVSAGVLQYGERPVSYNASSIELVGTADEVRTVYLYYDDPKVEGGTRTLGATTDSVASMAGYGRVLIDQVTVTFDSAGGTGTSGGGDIGGSGGGSGPTCPHEDAWMVTLDGVARAGDVAEGATVMLTDGRWARVRRARRHRSRLVRVVLANGHSLTCSPTAQLERAGGGYVLATACIGTRLTYWQEGRGESLVERVESAGEGWVVEFAVEHNSAFLVGDDPAHLLGHHNIKNDPLG